MNKKISLRTAGIIAGSAAVFAFLFGIIITLGLPSIANQGEALPKGNADLPLVTEEGESPFAKIVENVSPSVVNISAEKVVSRDYQGFNWYFEGPFEDFFKDFFRDFPRMEGKTQTLGSGFFIDSEGYLVTNYHVIKGAKASDIRIVLTNKQEFSGDEVKIIGTDSRTDIAVLKIESNEKFPPLKFGDSDNIKVGDWAIAVGNPFQLEGTVTVGVISAKGRANIPLPEGPDLQSFLQTDAAINPGNSGGPLLNIHGEVIGINTAITSPTGGNVGIGFAIPANLAMRVIDALRTEGRISRGYLGIYLQDISEDLKNALDLPSIEGILVSDVIEDTPADKAGLKPGDVILEYDGQKVKDLQSFRLRVSSTPAGQKVKMVVFRDGKRKNISVKIGEYPEEVSNLPGKDNEYGLGIKVRNINPALTQQYNIVAEEGVIVVYVENNSPAEDVGVQIGDVIIAIGKTKIRTIDDYYKTIKNITKGKPVIIHIQRGERKLYVALTPR